jgi:YbgC/YbaW family acyl-CoA thioester hydrolase
MNRSVPVAPPGVHSVTTDRRLTMGDVDTVQVYAPNYFRWMDQGIHEYFVSLGHPLSGVLGAGFGMPAVDASCRYFSPVVLDDVLECTTWVSRVGTASFDMTHAFRCDGRDVALGRMTHVWIEIGDRQSPSPVPAWLRDAAHDPASALADQVGGALDGANEAAPGGPSPRPGVPFTRCPGCGRVAFPVEATCVACGRETAADRSAAEGVLTTWTTVRHAPPGFEAPYVLTWVEIDSAGLAVMGTLDGGEAILDSLRAGLPVRVSALDADEAARTAVRVEVAS